MHTKQKGDLAVANAIQYYMTNGYEVCLPIGDKRPYDLVIEVEGVLKRVQVKYAGFYNGIQQHKVALRITGGNQSFSTTKKYLDNDFDELFVYTASGRKFVLAWDKITARNELNIEHPKYSGYEIV
ncbi:MAG TPA: group I intron-associated PD-(D/E)XK endonuclease [Verrucomicrobiae bacterium]|nr:group I intron-associated PD-(D/E)XK endonuclease [Verrucomicrobiae bacterium]